MYTLFGVIQTVRIYDYSTFRCVSTLLAKPDKFMSAWVLLSFFPLVIPSSPPCGVEFALYVFYFEKNKFTL
jgi:hypothetical protein